MVLLCDGRGVLAFCRERPTLPHQLGPPEMRVISFPSHMQKQGSERLSDLAEVTQLGAKVDMEPKSKKSVH